MFRKVIDFFNIVGMKHFWGDYFDSRFLIADIISKEKNSYILDIGCGAGVLLHLSNSKNKIGIEIELSALKQAQKLDNSINFIQADANHLPLKNNFCDLVLTMHLFPVMKTAGVDWKNAISEINRISTKNSNILIAGDNRMSKHFERTHSLEHRKSYLKYNEIINELQKYFSLDVEGYGPYSNIFMYPFKILFKFPDYFLEKFKIEIIIFNLLKSKNFLINGRSYIIHAKNF